MYRKVHFIALVSRRQGDLPGYTAYFFAREEKIVLPIEFAQEEVTYLLSLSKNKIARRQNIYETVIRIILGLGAEIESLSIYKYQDNEYYTYLNLKREGENLEVSLKFTDGLKIAKRAGASIYVKEEILENEGIKVNRQILRDALRD